MEMRTFSKGEAEKIVKGEQSLSRGTLLTSRNDDLSEFKRAIALKIKTAKLSIKPDHKAASSKEKKLKAFI